jgi:hypothetical protein
LGKQLQITLLPDWEQFENPDGPVSFIRGSSETSGVLQVSLYAEYKSGKIPNPTQQVLVEFAQDLGERHDFGILECTEHGTCELGIFGTAIFHSEESPRAQIWYLSNGKDFVLATYICSVKPEHVEEQEAQHIVHMIDLSES